MAGRLPIICSNLLRCSISEPRAETVSEEGKGAVEQWDGGLGEPIDEGLQAGQGRFAQPGAMPRQLHWIEFYQIGGAAPIPVQAGVAPSMGKTENPDFRIQRYFGKRKPRVLHDRLVLAQKQWADAPCSLLNLYS